MIVVRPPQRTALNAAALATALVAVVLGVWALRTFDPSQADSPFLPCLFHAITGWHCPGCGLTRALHALVHFDLARALAMNPLVVLCMPVLSLMAWHEFDGRRVLPAAAARVLFDARFWIALLVLFGVVRNLPWWPFSWLAPGALL